MHAQRTASTKLGPSRTNRLLLSTDFLLANLVSDDAGVVRAPAVPRARIAIHVGKPVWLDGKHGDESYAGLAIHGDIDIIPCGIPCSWEMKEADTALVLSPPSKYLERLAEKSGFDPSRLRIRNRFRIRDPQIEHIGWALMAEAEQEFPSGSMYVESLATALATRLLRSHSSMPCERIPSNGGLPSRKLRLVLAYIEENIGEKLSLESIAVIADLSVSHLKVLFRKSMGMPIHQYVIRRRVERAAVLLRRGDLPISQAALEAGFCHQSHLAMHMRRILGVSPREFSRSTDFKLLADQT